MKEGVLVGNKKGLAQKLKICYFWLFNPKYKNMLTNTCEFCGSSNLIARKQNHNDIGETQKEYTAEYTCMNCKSQSLVTQTWERRSEKEISELKQQIRTAKGD